MRFCGSMRILVPGIALAVALSGFKNTAVAQQVTYYSFDAPQASNSASYTCADPAHGTPTTPNPLFCFNDGLGRAANPSFLSDVYPAQIDPVTTDNPPVQGTHTAVQMTTPAQILSSSMWFSVPQKISSGFTSYFAFKITPNANSFATADGIAFVIQNSLGGTGTNCPTSGSGPTIVGGNGGCLGYGGIDNSLAIEFDTYRNPWDPVDLGTSTKNDNHIAVQNCGAGLPNEPDHTGSCLVNLSVNNAPLPAIIDPPLVTLADGNVHEVVVIYSGPTEAIPNQLQIFIDPPFVPGTHTPAAGAVPVLSGTYDISANINLINSGSANDSAYVGFTSATGAAFEQHELMAWTFTPHTTSTQQQPLNPPGQPTVFPFGAHVAAVTYPVNGPPTSGVDMILTANTITPGFFAQLVAGGPFMGSQCQVYDATGGNCIVYSVSCVTHGTNTIVPCPATTDPQNPILFKSAYDNTIQPISPGFIQGDPFYSLVTSVSGDGQTATVTCVGECSVTQGQTVTLGGSVVTGNTPSAFNGTFVVLTADPAVPNTFTFASTVSGSATGGYLTSSNVQNVFLSYVPQRIDGSTTGRVKNFSDFVVTSLTAAPTALAIQAPPVTYGSNASVTVTATSTNGTPTGNVSLTVDGGTPLVQPLSNGSTVFTLSGLATGGHPLSVAYATQGVFLGSTTTGNLVVNAATPTVTFTGAPATAAYGSSFVVAASSNASTTPIISAIGSCSILGNTVTITSGAGVCGLTATWAADSNYTAASLSQSTNAVKAASLSTIVVNSPNPSAPGVPVAFGFVVTGNGGNGHPTGTYTVATNVAGDPGCTGTYNAGVGSCSLLFSTSGARTITVTYSGDGNFVSSSASTQQTVAAAPIAVLSATKLDFGTVYAGTITVQLLALTNAGGAPMTIHEPFLSDVGGGNSLEFVALSFCPRTLAPGKTCIIFVNFLAGPIYTPQTATLKVMDNAPGNPQLVTLTAKVINPQASFRPAVVAFGTQAVGTTTKTPLLLTNTGGTPLLITSLGVTGPNAGDFSQTNNCPASLAVGSNCTVTVGFKPVQAGARVGLINLVGNLKNGSQQVVLTGTGK